MANGRRRFGREQQTALKVGIAGAAVAGMAATWLGFSRSHANPADSGVSAQLVASPDTETAPATATAEPTTTAAADPTATETTVATATEAPVETPAPVPTRAQTTRAS